MEKIKIKSKIDGLELSLLVMKPKKKAIGIVQISHGMAEHKERYIPFMKYLVNEGYICVINDHRGHGESVKKKKDLGYFYDKTGSYIVEDLHQITLEIKKEYPDLPVYLFGHSMGSLVVRKYIAKYDNDIAKLVICGSPSYNKNVNLAIFFIKFLMKFKGEYYRSNFINNLAFKGYNKKFTSKSANSWLCSDKEVVKAYEEDDLCGYIFTLNGFLNLFSLMKNVYTSQNYIVQNKELPILFIAGSDDPVIISEKNWYLSQEFLKKLGYNNITNIFYEKMRHELLNETNKAQIYDDVLKFLKK